MVQLNKIASSFSRSPNNISVTKLSIGNINQTFLVESLNSGFPEKLILQQINTSVFSDPFKLISNYIYIYDFAEFDKSPSLFNSSSILPRLIPLVKSDNFLLELDGQFWRAYEFVDSSTTYRCVPSESIAYQVGYGLGSFHYNYHDLPVNKLHTIIPNLHNTKHHYHNLVQSFKFFKGLNADCFQFNSRITKLINFVDQRKDYIYLLDFRSSENNLGLQLIHGDPKISNFLFDQKSLLFRSIIDLDTAQPGCILYDLGDCLRSICNIGGEDPQDLLDVSFNLHYCQSMLDGYIKAYPNFLNNFSIVSIANSIKIITFELGLRFLSDYFLGNLYFRTEYPAHNLFRAEVQFKLLESIESQWDSILLFMNKQLD